MTTATHDTTTTNDTTPHDTTPPADPAGFVATVEGDDLAGAFRRLRQIGRTRPVTITAYSRFLRLAVRTDARDLDAGSVYMEIPAQVSGAIGPSSAVVLARGVLDVDVPAGPVTIAPNGAGVPISIGGTRIAQDIMSYSATPDGSPFSYSSVPAAAFADAAARVLVAVGKDIARPALRGVLLDYAGGEYPTATLVACDSYRLHVATVETGVGGSVGDGPRLLPAAFVARVAREASRKGAGPSFLLSHSGSAEKGDGLTVASVAGVMVYAPELPGQYPDWRQLMDSHAGGHVLSAPVTIRPALLRESLADVTGRAKNAGIKDAPVRVEHDGSGARLRMVGENGEEITKDVGGILYGATFAPYGLNPRFLSDFLAAVGGEDRVTLYVNPTDPNRPVSVSRGPVGGVSFRALLMPVRLPR